MLPRSIIDAFNEERMRHDGYKGPLFRAVNAAMSASPLEVHKLGLENRDGDILVAKEPDGTCHLIAASDTGYGNDDFDVLGKTNSILISSAAFDALKP